jgi:hypothetical protein
MKVISYVGVECPTLVIDRVTDLYPALDYLQTRMIELSENESDTDKKNDLEKCADFISSLMDQSELNGYGSQEDVDNIKYS